MKFVKLIFLFFLSYNLNSQNVKENLLGIWAFKSNLENNHFLLSKVDSLNFNNNGFKFSEKGRLLVRQFSNKRVCMVSDLRFKNYDKGNWSLKNNILSIIWLKNKDIVTEKWLIINSSREELEIKKLTTR